MSVLLKAGMNRSAMTGGVRQLFLRFMINRLILFSLPIPFLAVCLVMIVLDGIFGDIDPEKMDRATLIRVIQLRDFRRLSPGLLDRLTDRAEKEFGRHSQKRPTFEFSSWEKNMHIYFQARRSSQLSYLENNLMLMAKIRYFQWMNEYQSVPLSRKAALMNDVVEDMRYWQGIYFDYLHSLELPEPSPIALYQDFQQMIEDFKVGASPEEAKQIDFFADHLRSALFAAEAQKMFQNWLSPSKRSP